ncbi:hypothetical protein CQW49_10160 [Methylosinus trichosporium OB3b]|uniref:Uncharacterized protein n=1 Tax=Methylosinus trichosporium (strain ATCC 35070 / NCIMB 11131 / UNIQEM 75 / OB3b) TaxID=595536 RepID=A0A2D2CZP8_METT3|nr:hypothetical protein CQW49_10160 [Methylosinus trichosporium OB3b]OBS53462.1 hypothetical protein A8B73_05975 [Methylosinus sp. 3S-1]
MQIGFRPETNERPRTLRFHQASTAGARKEAAGEKAARSEPAPAPRAVVDEGASSISPRSKIRP